MGSKPVDLAKVWAWRTGNICLAGLGVLMVEGLPRVLFNAIFQLFGPLVYEDTCATRFGFDDQVR